jgi:hypothetical protein
MVKASDIDKLLASVLGNIGEAQCKVARQKRHFLAAKIENTWWSDGYETNKGCL